MVSDGVILDYIQKYPAPHVHKRIKQSIIPLYWVYFYALLKF